MKAKLFRKGDIAVIAVILIIAAAFYFYKLNDSDKLEAIISVNGETVETIDLSAEKEKRFITLSTNPEVVIAVENGAIYFESSDCEDKLCVNCGKLTKKGDTAVCLPAKTVVTVRGADVDAMTY